MNNGMTEVLRLSASEKTAVKIIVLSTASKCSHVSVRPLVQASQKHQRWCKSYRTMLAKIFLKVEAGVSLPLLREL